MPDLAIGFAVGFLALPWLWMIAFTCLFLADVVLCEADEFGWGTTILVSGIVCFSWLGAGINPFTWVWGNLADLSLFLLAYFAIGALWSVAKWFLFLLKLRDQLKENIASWEKRKQQKQGPKPRRPEASFATNSKGRIMGWIGHWPFSMLGSLIGDILTRILKSIYNVLSGVYDRMSKSIFSEFNEEEE